MAYGSEPPDEFTNDHSLLRLDYYPHCNSVETLPELHPAACIQCLPQFTHPRILECILYLEFLALLKRRLLKSFSLFKWLPAFEFKKLEHQPFHTNTHKNLVTRKDKVTYKYMQQISFCMTLYSLHTRGRRRVKAVALKEWRRPCKLNVYVVVVQQHPNFRQYSWTINTSI